MNKIKTINHNYVHIILLLHVSTFVGSHHQKMYKIHERELSIYNPLYLTVFLEHFLQRLNMALHKSRNI
jgi:hypothetical protein